MDIRKCLVLFTLLTGLGFATGAAALDLGGHDRDGVVVGVTGGYGWNSAEYTRNGNDQDTGTINAFNLGGRVGWANSDYFIASLGLYGWKRSVNQNITPITISTFSFMAEAFLFPKGEGFWIKGGIGTGYLDLYMVTPDPYDSGDFRQAGFAWVLGVGYEFRTSDQVAIGICYDYQKIGLGDFDDVTNAGSVNSALSLNLHYYVD